MKSSWLPGANFIYITLLMLLFCGFQTTFWFSIFRTIPAPPLWLIAIIYVALYRRIFSSFLFIYFLGLIALSFTLMPLKMMMMSLFLLTTFLHFMKRRIFWSGQGYFVMVSTGAVFFYNIIYLILSKSLESNLIDWNLTDRIIQIGMTPFFSVFVYKILYRLDFKTEFLDQVESGGLEV